MSQDGKRHNNTLIQRGGGTRPYDARQPVKFHKGATSYRFDYLEDKGRRTELTTLFLF